LRIDEALSWAQATLINSESPLLDAQVLLAFTLKKETIYLMTWPERLLTPDLIEQFKALITLRLEGRPVAHLTGVREFWSLPLKVNDSTLIPRPDTEILVEVALEKSTQDSYILDLGTGTGAIIFALASELPKSTCLGVDLSQDAVDLACENRKNLGLEQVQIKQSSWFENVDGHFDLIVSNPPYIESNDVHLKHGDVRFEPLSALVANNKGLSAFQIIAEQAPAFLNKGGYLVFEHGYEQASAVQDILTYNSFSHVETRQDYAGNDRVTLGKLC